LPHTLAALALAFIEAELRDQPKGAWLLNTKVAQHLGCKPNAVWPSLIPAVNAGLIERSQSHNRATQWRLADPKRRRARTVAKKTTFSINWPPGFTPQFSSIAVPTWDWKVRA
jgi:hypothetical protein